jgi:transcriptional regulator with XRE-family HTH domain
MDILFIVGNRLRVLRSTRNESLSTVANKTKIAASTISKIERGLIDFRLDKLFSLCRHYRVHPATLFENLPRENKKERVKEK